MACWVWKIEKSPGILRNSREKEIKKNPHGEEINPHRDDLHDMELKNIPHREDFILHRDNLHSTQGKLKNIHV